MKAVIQRALVVIVAIAVVGTLAGTLLQGRPVAAQSRGNVLAVAMHFYPSTFDPAIGVAGPHYRLFVNIYEGLVGYERGTSKLVPALAQSWSSWESWDSQALGTPARRSPTTSTSRPRSRSQSAIRRCRPRKASLTGEPEKAGKHAGTPR